MSKQKRILVVGAGVMGSYHARVISQSSRASLAGIVDMSPDAGKALSERFQTTWYSEIPDLTKIDGVVVAAPTEVHFDIARLVLDAGVALLLEKPLTSELASAETLVNFADAHEIPLMCGFLERYNPAILTAMQIVRDPVHLSATRHSPYASRIKTGASWDLLVHDVDLLNRFVNNAEPEKVQGQLGFFHPDSLNSAEDVAECLIKFSNGAIGQASASRVGHRKIRTLSVTESNRLIEIDLLRKDVTVYTNVSDQMVEEANRGYRQQTVIEIPEIISSQEPLSAQLDRFLNLIEGKVDPAEERQTLLPAHRIISQINSSQ
jgi:predicted dehydrogenase